MTAQSHDRFVFTALISGLRGRLDAAIIRIADLEAERDAMSQTLLGEAGLADAEHEAPERKGSAWWMAAWREVSRHRTELLARVQQLEGWLRASGEEASRLQRELAARDQEIGELSRQLDLAREGERPIDEVDQDAPAVIPEEEIH